MLNMMKVAVCLYTGKSILLNLNFRNNSCERFFNKGGNYHRWKKTRKIN